MTVENLAGRHASRAHGFLPVEVGGRQVDLGEHHLDHPVDDLLLGGDVVVDRHRAHIEGGGQLADGERLDADLVGEVHRCLQNPLSGEGRSFGRLGHFCS